MPNIEKLKKVRDHINKVRNMEIEGRFDYGIVWKECGSIGCVAGFTNNLFPVPNPNNLYVGMDDAAETLELSSEMEGDWLFCPWDTDKCLVDEDGDEMELDFREGDEAYSAEEALRRLDWLIAGKAPEEYIPPYYPDAISYNLRAYQ